MYAGHKPVCVLKEGNLGLASKPACTHIACQADSKPLHLQFLSPQKIRTLLMCTHLFCKDGLSHVDLFGKV